MQLIGPTFSLIILAARTSRQFELQKRSHLLIRTHNETLSVAAMCVCNPHRSPGKISSESSTSSVRSAHRASGRFRSRSRVHTWRPTQTSVPGSPCARELTEEIFESAGRNDLDNLAWAVAGVPERVPLPARLEHPGARASSHDLFSEQRAELAGKNV